MSKEADKLWLISSSDIVLQTSNLDAEPMSVLCWNMDN